MSSSKVKPLDFKKSGLNRDEWNILKKLSTPQKIQDFLNSLPFNFEKKGETHHSVRDALLEGQIHCFEGALIAAAAMWVHGQRPLLLDLVALNTDFDHVVALFNVDGYWGAVSKTNHAVLRYREPVYQSVRELVMSYFHEYFLHNGKKTLRGYSEPFDLSRVGLNPVSNGVNWIVTEENLADLAHALDHSPHTKILSRKQIRRLRQADEIEIQTGKIVEYKKSS